MRNLIISFLLCVALVTPFLLLGCDKEKSDKTAKFSVSYIDVGTGDCTLITLPNGKTALINCGANIQDYNEKLISYITGEGVNKIDYLFLSNPLDSKISLAKDIIDKFDISTAYIPKISDYAYFTNLSEVVNLLAQKGATVKNPFCLDYIVGEDYYFLFLTPNSQGSEGCSYDQFNLASEPTEAQIKNLSSIIYFNYKGVSFIFGGDADNSQEEIVLENYKLGVYNERFENFSLENIDFYKCADNGSDNSNCYDYLKALSPKRAIISVGGDVNGKPSSYLINRLLEINQDCEILRTDMCGTIKITLSNGQLNITKSYNT